jgi:hypothetical protein
MPIFEAVVVTCAIYSASMVVSHVLTSLCCEPREPRPPPRERLAIFLFPERPMPIDEAAPVTPDDEALPQDCAICFDAVKGKTCRKTKCGHAFCAECLEAWYKINPKCPLCNQVYTVVNDLPVPIWMGD